MGESPMGLPVSAAAPIPALRALIAEISATVR